MRLAHAIAAILLMLNFAAQVAAGPLEDAVAAAHKGDYAAAHQLLHPLADNGDARAQYNLGYLYLNGWGVQRDYAEAAKWFRKAADQDLAIAQYNLGIAYANGDGVAQDRAEAARWYRLAADQGYAVAQYTLGVAYANGRGIPRDLISAYMWLRLSAMQFFEPKAVDKIARDMTPAQIAEAQKLARQWKAKSKPETAGPSSRQTQNASQELLGSDLHFGKIADLSVWPISAVGLVTVMRDLRPRQFCTGTLVAPKLVLTAAHCLFLGKKAEDDRLMAGERSLVVPGEVRFLAGYKHGLSAAYSVAERLVVPKEYVAGPANPAHTANDWAVIVLRDALSIRPVSVKSITHEQFHTVSNSHSVLQVGYGGDRPYLPSIVHDCRVSEGLDERVFIYQCLTYFGYSGAPIIAEIDGTPSVIGIGSTGILWERQGTACSASQFEKAVTELMQSK